MTNAISGAFLEFQTAVLKALPRDRSDADYLSLAHDGKGLSRFLAGLTLEGLSIGSEAKAPAILQYPANNEKFELTIDGQTKWFMLVSVGYQPSWKSLQAALTPHGSATGESERAAFKKKFPQADGKGPVGFTKIPSGRAHFPYVDSDGDLHFGWPGPDFGADWRWLVVVQAV